MIRIRFRRSSKQRAASKRNLINARKKRRKKPKYGYSPSGRYVGTQRSGKGTRKRKRSK